jgi:hypothetical protein
VRQAIARGPEPTAANPAEVWILLGGLPKLLASLHHNFDFAPPRDDELQHVSPDGRSVERLPVHVIRGRWKPDRLAAVLAKGKGKDAPQQLPDAVELVLGRADQPHPLFPYRITYLQDAEADGAQGRGGEPLRPMLVLELYGVHRKGDLDPRDFDYQPGSQDVADLTTAYLQRLGLAKAR